jgi:hypothetical protein
MYGWNAFGLNSSVCIEFDVVLLLIFVTSQIR